MEIGWRMINHPLQDAERDTIVVQFDAVDDQDDLTLDGSLQAPRLALERAGLL